MALDCISTYFPESIDATRLQDMRSRLAIWYQGINPTVDTRPGSVFGDNILQPAAELLCAIEQGTENILSDLELANVAEGIIFNCDFVTGYVDNFAVTDNEDSNTTGLVRLVFSENLYVEIDKGTQFLTGSLDGFYPRLYSEGNLEILTVGQIPEAATNQYTLSQTSDSRYFVDIPVYGEAGIEIVEGTSFNSSVAIDNLTSITAIADFNTGTVTSSLAKLAEKARKTIYSATMSSRTGMMRALQKEFPDLLVVSPVIPGDYEMNHSFDNGAGLSVPTVDVFVKSNLYGSSFKQVIKLIYDEANDTFFSEIVFAHAPLGISLVEWVGDPTLTLNPTMYVRSKETYLPKLASSFSIHNQYWVAVPMPRGLTDNAPLIEIALDDNDQPYQYFEITYYCDPMLATVARFLEGTDTLPVGLVVSARSMVPIIFDTLKVSYRRKKGTKLKLGNAAQEIEDYMRAVGWPDPYTDSAIIDSMYYAGASSITTIGSVATLRTSAANFYVTDVNADTLDDILLSNVEAPTYPIFVSDDFLTQDKDESLVDADNLRYAHGPRNLGYVLVKENIQFLEV